MSDKCCSELLTRVGHFGFEEHLFFGWKLSSELVEAESLNGIMALACTGRRLAAEDWGVLDDIAVSWTLADPRIWPLKLCRVAASYGSPMAGFAATALLMDTRTFAFRGVPEVAETLLDLAAHVSADLDDASAAEIVRRRLKAKRHLHGFGVPMRDQDERMAVLRRCLERRGDRHQRRYWRLLEQVAAALEAQRGLRPTINAGVAAALLDVGLQPPEMGPLCILLGSHMVMAHAVEAAGQQARPLQELPAEHTEYQGRPPRLSPRAQAEARGGETP